MRTRIITGLIFAAVMIGGIYGGPITYGLLFGLITILSMWEFYSLTLDDDLIRKLSGIGLGMSLFIITYLIQDQYFQDTYLWIISVSVLFFPILFLLFIYELFKGAEKPFTNLGYLVLGIVYIAVPFSMLHYISFLEEHHNYAPNIVMGLLLLTWANDVCAYFVGSKFGKTKLFERISPKKTWEGSLGGVVGTILVGGLLSYFFTDLSLVNWMALGAIVSIFGSLGDLVESMLKRSLKIKDSGTLLPGHGGFLDRFDAFIFLIPFAVAYLLIFRV